VRGATDGPQFVEVLRFYITPGGAAAATEGNPVEGEVLETPVQLGNVSRACGAMVTAAAASTGNNGSFHDLLCKGPEVSNAFTIGSSLPSSGQHDADGLIGRWPPGRGSPPQPCRRLPDRAS
jgi:hypothetical protein